MWLTLYTVLIVGAFQTAVDTNDLHVSIDPMHGNYNVTVNERVWFRSSYTAIYADHRWYRSDEDSLSLISTNIAQGNDPYLGRWNETQLVYRLTRDTSVTNVTSSIRQWESISAISFHLNTGDQSLPGGMSADTDQVRTVFPSFLFEQVSTDDHRGILSFAGNSDEPEDKFSSLIALRKHDRIR